MPRLEFDAAKRETGRAVEGGVLMRAGSAYCRAIALLLFFFPLFSPAYVQTSTAPSPREGTREQRAARAFEKARDNPLELHAFLVRMPKGGDLHPHPHPPVYAQSRIPPAAQAHP